MFRSLCICIFTYSRIWTSSNQTVLTQYPFAQKWRPQYRFFNSRCISKIFMALFPFKNPTVSDIEYFGGIERIRWMWSICTLPSKISIFLHSHNCLMIFLIDFPTSPLSIRNRYFGHQTIWYLHCQTACDNFLNWFIEYLLLIFRVTTTQILGRYSFYVWH